MAPARGKATTKVLMTERTMAWPVKRRIRSTEASRQPSLGKACSHGGNSLTNTTSDVRFATTAAVRLKIVWKGRRPGGAADAAGAGGGALAGIRRRMIVDDPPAFGPLPEDDGRHPRQLLPIRQGEPPAAARERRLRPQGHDVHRGEIELPHLLARTLVARAIAVEGRLPPASLLAVREEDEVRRLPVACHVALEVAAVPGLDLGGEDGPRPRFRIRGPAGRRGHEDGATGEGGERGDGGS